MPDGLDLSQDFLPEPALLGALRPEITAAERSGLVALLRLRVEKNRTGLKNQADQFAKMYDDALHGNLPAQDLVRLAQLVRESENGAAEQLHPWMEALRSAIALRPDLSSQEPGQHLQELLEIAADWLVLYQSLHARLLRLASERRAASGEILRARPVAGEVDHAALSREFMARFPKIRAALAK